MSADPKNVIRAHYSRPSSPIVRKIVSEAKSMRDLLEPVFERAMKQDTKSIDELGAIRRNDGRRVIVRQKATPEGKVYLQVEVEVDGKTQRAIGLSPAEASAIGALLIGAGRKLSTEGSELASLSEKPNDRSE